MNLYLLSQTEHQGYDTYDSCVVCANSTEDAKTITPNDRTLGECFNYGDWATTIENVNCVKIGEANKKQSRGVVCASFNAG